MSKPSSRSSTQLPLDLPLKASVNREDLIETGANSTAIAMIDAWPDWPGNLTVLAGPVGSGKSHISNVWLETANGVCCPLAQAPSRMEEISNILDAGGNLLLEDAAPGQIDETVLFHLLNFIRETGSYCLITSRTWPLEWNIKLPDLLSRLRAAQVIELNEPDDFLLKQVIIKLFADRQIMIDEKIVEYCTLRMERSLETAARLVAAIDAEALAKKSPVSRAIAAKVLEEMGMT